MQELVTTDELATVLRGLVKYIKDNHVNNDLLCHPFPADVFMSGRDMRAMLKLLPDSASRFRPAVGADLLVATADGENFNTDFESMIHIIEQGGRGMVIDLGFKNMLPVEFYMLDKLKGILRSKISENDFVIFQWSEKWEDSNLGELQFINLVDVLQQTVQ